MWRLRKWIKRIIEIVRAIQADCTAKKLAKKWKALAENLPKSHDGKTLVHIGCGDINAPGFINIDARPLPHIHIVTTNLLRLGMVPDNTADLIYMSHVLEHVSHREIVATLQDMRRILKKDGVLRISVPDFDKIIDIYQGNECDIATIQQPLMGGQDYPFNYHYAVFNADFLSKTMLRSGFRETRAWNPHDCDNHDFEDWASRNISWEGREFPISLNIEGIK